MTDNTLTTAIDLGVLNELHLKSNFDLTDRIAFYKFTLPQPSDLSVAIGGNFMNADLATDLNTNGIIDNGEIISSFDSRRNLFEPLPAGIYVVQLRTFSTVEEPYDLSLLSEPIKLSLMPDPGNSIAQALELGALSTERTLSNYVGKLDRTDFYRFTLSKNARLNILIAEESSVVPVNIISDRNNNGVIDTDEAVANRFSDHNVISANLPAGTHIIQVGESFSTVSSHYELVLNQVPTPVPKNRLRGTSGEDAIKGLYGNDTILGLGGKDRLLGGAGSDTLIGGKGADVITTGNGRDRIVVRPKQGLDRITDFNNKQDKIDLGDISFGQLTFHQQQFDLLIKVGQSNLLLIENTDLSTINRTCFTPVFSRP